MAWKWWVLNKFIASIYIIPTITVGTVYDNQKHRPFKNKIKTVSELNSVLKIVYIIGLRYLVLFSQNIKQVIT